MAGTSDELAKDAKIQELTKHVEMDKMFKVTLVSGWMTREANKDKELTDLKSEVQKLKDELAKKGIPSCKKESSHRTWMPPLRSQFTSSPWWKNYQARVLKLAKM